MRLVIGILSAKGYSMRRQGCEDAWAGSLPPDIDRVYLIGDFKGGVTRAGDVLQLPCPDGYRFLPQNTRHFLDWGTQTSEARWLFKCDDDTYVNIARLKRLVDETQALYLGCPLFNHHVHYACGGAGYLLHRDAALHVVRSMTEATGPEDILVGKHLRANGISLTTSWRFRHRHIRRPTPDNAIITCHDCEPDLQREIARAFRE